MPYIKIPDPNCPRCLGTGRIPEVETETRPTDNQAVPCFTGRTTACGCGQEVPPRIPGLTGRRNDVSLADFRKWWNRRTNTPPLRDEIMERVQRKLGADTNKIQAETLFKQESEPANLSLHFKEFTTSSDTDMLWISGPPRSGKSSLAGATTTEWVCNSEDGTAIYLTGANLAAALVAAKEDRRTFQGGAYANEVEILTPLIQAPLLVIDDWERLNRSGAVESNTQETVHSDRRVAPSVDRLLHERFEKRRPTIIVSLHAPLSLEGELYDPLKGVIGSTWRERLQEGVEQGTTLLLETIPAALAGTPRRA